MNEWHINRDLEYLHRVIHSAMSGSVSATPIFSRLFRLGVLSLIHSINYDLGKLSQELDFSIKLEGVSIDFDKYLDNKYWTNNYLLDDEIGFYKVLGVNMQSLDLRFDINEMTDYFPNGVEGYRITQDLINTFKVSMHQLCDMSKLGNREVVFSIAFGLHFMMKQLADIKNKVEHPKSHLYTKIWEEILKKEEATTPSKTYIDWKEEVGLYKAEDLKKQQKYEIFLLLSSGFFRYYNSIIGADVKNCKLSITEDDLPVGCVIPENLPVECAKFEKFSQWKEGYILSLNYEKLGQYIYKNYSKLELKDLRNIVIADKTIDLINEDMAQLKPKLAQYLKNYEETVVSKLAADCTAILETCKPYIAKGLRPTLLSEFLKKLLYDKDMKDEARKKLSGSSRNTFICQIVAALKYANIFRVDCDNHDLAKCLHQKITKVAEANLAKYIERFYNARTGTVHEWTNRIIGDFKEKPYNPFEGLFK